VYFVDRVSRPSEYVPDLLFNVFGGIQPEKAAEVLASCPDDGLGARFACIWPDLTSWQLVDRFPNKAARDALDSVHDRLVQADWSQELLRDEFTATSCCRLDPEAQAIFDGWYGSFMGDLRNRLYSGRLLGRLGKYPGFLSRVLLVCWLLEWAERWPQRGKAQRVPASVADSVIRLVTSYCRPMDERVYAAFSTAQKRSLGGVSRVGSTRSASSASLHATCTAIAGVSVRRHSRSCQDSNGWPRIAGYARQIPKNVLDDRRLSCSW
jgi:hypothetical protein